MICYVMLRYVMSCYIMYIGLYVSMFDGVYVYHIRILALACNMPYIHTL